jgi:TATA-box binding protein (TBP) (component of TFIID and TFIIIB)
MTTEKDVYPEFDSIPVSTKTFIVMTNIIIDLKKLFDFLPITDFTVLTKKRGRKTKPISNDLNKDVIDGSIITLKYENQIRGVDLKLKKTNKKKKSKWFRNSFTVVIILDKKAINFKICSNGMWQVTGAKHDGQVESCVKYIWNHIHSNHNNIYSFTRGKYLEAIFIPAMRNIDFSLGFLINREKLARYMCTQTEFHSLLETSFGYTGVNIKIKVKDNICSMELRKLTFLEDEIKESSLLYGEYISRLSEKEQQKKIKKDRYTTFLVFHSGKVIVSGITADITRPSYEYFLKIIQRCKNDIEERLEI